MLGFVTVSTLCVGQWSLLGYISDCHLITAGAKHLGLKHTNTTIQPHKGSHLHNKCIGNCNNKISPHINPKLQTSQNIKLPSEGSKGAHRLLCRQVQVLAE